MESDDSEALLCCTHLICSFIFACLIVVALYFFSVWLVGRTVLNTITASVSLATIDYDVSATGGSLNATFDVRIKLKNRGVDNGIDYGGTSMFLRHKGEDVGEFPIAGAHVEDTRAMGLLLTLVSNANTSSSMLYSDVVSGGVLELQAYVRFTGKGRNAKVFEVRPVAEATCDIWINLSSRALSYGECHESPPETKERP